MATKKELETKDLERQCEEARKTFERLSALLEEQKQKEAAEKKAKLTAEKETRYKEVLHAYENFEELRGKFVEDYGCFTFGFKTLDLSDGFWKACGLF